jgi:hypothetical protein
LLESIRRSVLRSSVKSFFASFIRFNQRDQSKLDQNGKRVSRSEERQWTCDEFSVESSQGRRGKLHFFIGFSNIFSFSVHRRRRSREAGKNAKSKEGRWNQRQLRHRRRNHQPRASTCRRNVAEKSNVDSNVMPVTDDLRFHNFPLTFLDVCSCPSCDFCSHCALSCLI